VFKIYDIDNTGFITLDNLAEFLGLIDEKEYLEMHESFCSDTEIIDFPNFCKLLKKIIETSH